MKIRIDKPCNENWDDMSPDEKGKFCNQCSKSVIDFTQMSVIETVNVLQSSVGEICGRVTSSQLNEPFIIFKPVKQSFIPYAKVAANVMLIASSFGLQSCNAQIQDTGTHIQPIIKEIPEFLKGEVEMGDIVVEETIQHKSKVAEVFKFSGTIQATTDSLPVHNAKIEFLTLDHVYQAFTNAEGKFSMELPIEVIKEQNVVRTTYKEIKKNVDEKTDNFPFLLKSEDLILSREELGTQYGIMANLDKSYLGGIRHIQHDIKNPIVLDNGMEIPFEEFQKNRKGEKSTCNLADKPYYYFYSAAAQALYGPKAETGLYLFFDSNKTKL